MFTKEINFKNSKKNVFKNNIMKNRKIYNEIKDEFI